MKKEWLLYIGLFVASTALSAVIYRWVNEYFDDIKEQRDIYK